MILIIVEILEAGRGFSFIGILSVVGIERQQMKVCSYFLGTALKIYFE